MATEPHHHNDACRWRPHLVPMERCPRGCGAFIPTSVLAKHFRHDVPRGSAIWCIDPDDSEMTLS